MTVPVVIMPVSPMDWHLAVKCAAWMKFIARRADRYDLVFLCSTRLSAEDNKRLLDEAECPGINARVAIPDGVIEGGYFAAPNFMILAALELGERDFPGRPILWMEADCVPMHAGWLQEIAKEYAACGKPFLGDHALDTQIPHLTGNAVYPPNWRELAPLIAASIKDPKWGWDSQAAPETFPQSARSKRIRQVWRPKPFTPLNWRGIVGDETALFHQDKTGSLIDSLADGVKMPTVNQIEKSTYIESVPAPAYGLNNVEILYVTCAKDIPFLQYSLQGVQKFAKGFRGVTVAVPQKEAKQFEWVASHGAKPWFFDEVEGKGFMHHELIICRADEVCPQAQAILHLDADVMPWAEFTPQNYIVDNKPVLVRETYDQAAKHNPNRLFWRKAVTDALGWQPQWETMVMHPNIHLREVYPFLRRMVENHTAMPFDQYVLSCKNDWPMGFCEFVSLGSMAIRYFSGSYHFIDYDRERDARECGIPHLQHQYIYRKGRDFMAETWSHGGIAMYESWLRQWLDGRPGAYWTK